MNVYEQHPKKKPRPTFSGKQQHLVVASEKWTQHTNLQTSQLDQQDKKLHLMD